MEKSSKLYKHKTKKHLRRKSNKMMGGYLKKKQTVLIEPSPLHTIKSIHSNTNVVTPNLEGNTIVEENQIVEEYNKETEPKPTSTQNKQMTLNKNKYIETTRKIKKYIKKGNNNTVNSTRKEPIIETIQEQTYHSKPKIIPNPSVDKKHLIKQNNINKIINKTKTQNETMVENISLIGNEIDYLKQEIKNDKDPNDRVNNIIQYLETHIQELTISRAKLLYNSNDNEARAREQKKKSFFNKFKKNTVKNTSKQIINKQYYYRLLTETNLIIKIIK